mgnify:CR=1 FL=1
MVDSAENLSLVGCSILGSLLKMEHLYWWDVDSVCVLRTQLN